MSLAEMLGVGGGCWMKGVEEVRRRGFVNVGDCLCMTTYKRVNHAWGERWMAW